MQKGQAFYPEILFEEYNNGLSKEELMQKVYYSMSEQSLDEKDRIHKIMGDYDQVIEHIFPKLINTDKNKYRLKRIVSEPFLDLSVTFIYMVSKDDYDYQYIPLETDDLVYFGITEQKRMMMLLKMPRKRLHIH